MVGLSRSSLVVLAALLFSFELVAAPIAKPASSADVFVKGGQTLNINNHWGEIIDAKPISGGSVKVDVPVTLKRGFAWSKVNAAAKLAIKRSPYVFASTAAVGFLLDQIPGALYDAHSNQFLAPPGPNNTTVVYWARSWGTESFMADTPLKACQGDRSTNVLSEYQATSTSIQCHTSYGYWLGNVNKITRTCPYGNVGYQCNAAPQVPAPFTDAHFESLASGVPDVPADMWAEFGPALADIPGTFDSPDEIDFTGPASIDLPSITTTATNPVTGDITVTESLPSLQLDYGTAPLSITPTPTTTTNTYTNGNLTNTSTTTTNNSTSSVVETAPEIPTDCDFMPTVCGFIDWVKEPFEPEEIDLAEYIEDEDFTKEVTFSGNATCPPPTTITTAFGDQFFDWTPGCDWAAMLKPLVVLGALLAALYISLGIGRSD